jgi:hypothetical protein
VNSRKSRATAKQIVQDYFRKVRPELVDLQLDTAALDQTMQHLLHLSNGRNRRTSYLRIIREIARTQHELEAQRELRLGELAVAESREAQIIHGTDAQIFDTLSKLLPSSALSYKQVVTDLSAEGRVSFRGTALELRETLREVLDHLAPDQAVIHADDFKLEKGRSTPTMKQKVRFILRSRGMPKNAAKAPEHAVSLMEERTASFARSTYERGSISTHAATTKQEVQQLKMYVDSVLCELLEIHQSPVQV